jgi:hypothetical protein
MKSLRLLVYVLLLNLLFTACRKPSSENFGVITGSVKHHEWTVSGVRVFLKKGVTEFPGKDTTLYDEVCTATGIDATYAFRKLPAGNYYLLATGYDSLFRAPVRGWTGISIASNQDIIQKDIAVSE